MLPNISSSSQLTPFFDKVSFTYYIPEAFRNTVLQTINDPSFYVDYKRKVYPGSNGRYNNNYQFNVFDNITIEVSLYPINTNQNFIRVEYNPANLDVKGRLALRQFLVKLLGLSLAKNIYFEANVTRIDLTIDDYEMESNLYIYRPGSRVSSLYRPENDGGILSQVIGSDSSDIRVTLYDKDAQISGLPSEAGATSYQRLEIRYRLRGFTMTTLDSSLLDEFEKVRFYRAGFLEDDRFDTSFVKTAYKRGVTLAMAQMDDASRRRYRRYLEDYRVHPINMAHLNFDLAHYYAFRSLVHPDFKDKKMVKKQRSLLQGGVLREAA
jgi:hypothetical protein